MKYLLISLLWTGYCALHSYLISINFTKLMMRLLKKYYAFYRLFYVIISIILFIPLIRLTSHLNGPVIVTLDYPFSLIRYILMAGSLLMFFWAFFFDYDSLSFWGIRQILNREKTVQPETDNTIKKGGLLGIIRHPMYLALIIYLWSQTKSIMDITVYIVFTVYIVIGTLLEEKKLMLEFGNAYIEYQQEVPMLIPFTKKNHRPALAAKKQYKIA